MWRMDLPRAKVTTHAVPGAPRAAGIGRRSRVALAGLVGAVTLVFGLGAATTSAAAAAVPSYAWATQAGGPGDDSGQGVSALPDGSSIITGQFNGIATFGNTILTSDGSDDSFTAKVNANGSYAWATQSGGTGNAGAAGVSALADGSSIITGIFDGIATFGTTTLTSDSEVGHSFTAKVNADGSYAWATQSGGTGNALPNGVSAFADGSSIITGFFKGTATFGTTTLTSTGGLYYDAFTAKVNANGSYAWATQSGGTGNAVANGVSALADGSSIITGNFTGTATFGTTTLTSTGLDDVFTAKVNADGSYAWATQSGGTGAAVAYGVSALADGSSIITGNFGGIATFGTTILTSDGKYDVFTVKVNADGSYAWATQSEGADTAIAFGVSALPDGSSIITGNFSGSKTFGATILTSDGSYDVFTVKVNANGSYAWAIKAGGTGGYAVANGVSALADGSSIITGQFNGTATFGTTTLTSTGGSKGGDVFTAKVNADGSYAWATKAGGPVNTFTMKTPKIWPHKITTQLKLPGPGKVAQLGTTSLSTRRASLEMAKTARTMTVCTARKTVAKAGWVTITCSLSAKARAARKKHSLKLRLVTTFTPTGGSAKSVGKTLVLKKTRPSPFTG